MGPDRAGVRSVALVTRWELGFLLCGWLVLGATVALAGSIVASRPPLSWVLSGIYVAAIAGSSLYRIRVGSRGAIPLIGASVALIAITEITAQPLAVAGVFGAGVFLGYIYLLKRPGLAAYAAAVAVLGALGYLLAAAAVTGAGIPRLAALGVGAAVYIAVVLLIEFARQRGRWGTDGGFGIGALRPLRITAVWALIAGISVLLHSVQSALVTVDALPSESAYGALMILAVATILVSLALVRELRTIRTRLAGLVEAGGRLPWDDVDDHEAYLVALARRTVHADEAMLTDREPSTTEIGAPVLDAEGDRRWLIARRDLNATAFADGDRLALDALAHIGSEVVRSRADMRALERRADTDSLTGLPNYKSFHEALARANDARPVGTAIAVLYLDLDDFKDLNDRFGHPFGDKVLTRVVGRITASVRPDDVVARVGGDEFAVILTPLASLEQAQTIAERIINHTGRPLGIEGVTVQPRLSVGLAFSTTHEADVTRLVEDADRTMLAAKQRGKVETLGSPGNLGVSTHRSSRIEDLVAAAIADNSHTLAFQPIVSLVADQVWAFEALLRVKDEDGSPVSPELFVEKAKHLGLFTELSRQVVRRALEAGERFGAINRAASCVTVNIEAGQMLPGELGDFLEDIVEEFPAVQLCLELNERSLAIVSDELRAQAEHLRDIGILVALDDYGSEGSSVGALVRMPMDILKIDRTLASDLDGAAQPAVLRALQTFGDTLDYSIVVEGVENAESAEVLRSISVLSAQGYYYGRPMSADATLARLQRHGARAVLDRDALQALLDLQSVDVATDTARS